MADTTSIDFCLIVSQRVFGNTSRGTFNVILFTSWLKQIILAFTCSGCWNHVIKTFPNTLIGVACFGLALHDELYLDPWSWIFRFSWKYHKKSLHTDFTFHISKMSTARAWRFCACLSWELCYQSIHFKSNIVHEKFTLNVC